VVFTFSDCHGQGDILGELFATMLLDEQLQEFLNLFEPLSKENARLHSSIKTPVLINLFRQR